MTQRLEAKKSSDASGCMEVSAAMCFGEIVSSS